MAAIGALEHGLRTQRVQLWDWERFTQGVPFGFDALHYRAQVVRHDRRGLRAAEAVLLEGMPALLQGLGVRDAGDRGRLMLGLYLLEVSGRYLGTATAGVRPPQHPRAARG
jgi:hypothetical protein